MLGWFTAKRIIAAAILIIAIMVAAYIITTNSQGEEYQKCLAQSGVDEHNWWNSAEAIDYCAARSHTLPSIKDGIKGFFESIQVFLNELGGVLWQPGVIILVVCLIIIGGLIKYWLDSRRKKDPFFWRPKQTARRPQFLLINCWTEKNPQDIVLENEDGSVSIKEPVRRVFIIGVYDLTITMYDEDDSAKFKIKKFKDANPEITLFDRDPLEDREMAEKLIEKMKLYVEEKERAGKVLTLDEKYFPRINIALIGEQHWFSIKRESVDREWKQSQTQMNRFILEKEKWKLLREDKKIGG